MDTLMVRLMAILSMRSLTEVRKSNVKRHSQLTGYDSFQKMRYGRRV